MSLIASFRFLAAALLATVMALPAAAYDTRAKSAYVVDLATGTVLVNKNADTPLPPASMSKLMTLYIAFEAVEDGRLSMSETLPVSQHAMNYGGSTMFLDTTDRVSVEDLIRGIIVLSGNDACAVIAEALSPNGTEAGFAQYMTQRAQKMGMTNSTFANSNGWPDPNHRMSMRDLALLATRLIEDFPQYYPMFAETEFKFDGRAPDNTRNRNPLLKLGVGADGLKTGHTTEAGYGLVGSAVQGDRRIVFVLSGMDSTRTRAEEAEAVVNWSFRHFTLRPVAKEGNVIAEADVWMGRESFVGLVPAKDVMALLPSLGTDAVNAEVVYKGPIEAPITKGQALAELIIKPEGMEETSVTLVADRDIPTGGFFTRVKTAAVTLMRKIEQGPEGAS